MHVVITKTATRTASVPFSAPRDRVANDRGCKFSDTRAAYTYIVLGFEETIII